MFSPHHHLRVDDEINGEDDGSDPCVYNFQNSVVWNEDHYDAADNEDKKDASHGTPTGGEVYFGLKMRLKT